MSQTTEGEKLFAKYLVSQDLKPDHEPQWPHSLKRPDYRLNHPSGPIVLEVKDIEYTFKPGARTVYPYKPIRDHLALALKENLRDFKAFSCVVVLFSRQPAFLHLTDPNIMFGSMYGDLHFSFPIGGSETDHSAIRPFFKIGKGKMLRGGGEGKAPEYMSTRISAVITLREFIRNLPLLHEALAFAGDQDSRRRVWEARESDVGVIVWENHLADKALPEDLFRGPWDIRWRAFPSEKEARIVFQGDAIATLQARD